MKKTFLLLILTMVIGMITVSCRKNIGGDEPIEPTEKTYKAVIKANMFKMEVKGFNSSGKSTESTNPTDSLVKDSLGKYLDRLDYMIYKENGELVSQGSQNDRDTAFGKYSANLPAGKYTIVVAGGEAGYNAGGYLLGGNNLFNAMYQIDETYLLMDGFLKTDTMTISTSNVSKPFNIERVISQLHVILTDTLRADVHHFKLDIMDYKNGIYVRGGNSIGSIPVRSRSIMADASMIGKKGLKLALSCIPQDNNKMVRITALDKDNKMLGYTEINDVPLLKNKKTVLSGQLFKTLGTGGGNVGVQPIWGDSLKVTF